MDAACVAALAARLDVAEATREQIGHFSREFPDMTIDDAYAIQRAWMERKRAAGRTVIGHKIGLTSRAMQRSSNITEPDYGTLLDDMMFGDGTEVPFSRFIVPRIEMEIAFVLRKRLSGPGCTLFDVLNATDFVIPAVEIIDARIRQIDPETGATRTVRDTIADNAANAGIIIGARPVRPMDVDLRWVAAILSRNAAVEESGVAAAVLNHPAHGPAWLANKLFAHGESLEAGEIILSGSFISPVPGRVGDTFVADYGPLGTLSFRLV